MADSGVPNPDEARGAVVLELSSDQALVLFELLAQADDGKPLTGVGPAEQRVLWHIEGQLEKRLVAPFSSDYPGILSAAESRILRDEV